MKVGTSWRFAALVSSLGVAAGSCGGGGGSSPPSTSSVADGGLSCAQPEGLDPEACLLPWPSSTFLVADATTRTGFRVSIPEGSMPVSQKGVSVDPAPWNRADGFSPMTSLLVEFASVIDPSPLATWHDPGASLAPSSPTVLVDVDTGQRVAHFAEVETSPDVAPGHTELYVRPAARLAEGHHYAVGIRGLVDKDGTAVALSAPFVALRDKQPSPAVDGRRAAFESAVFAPLAAAGVARSSLQMAWDFRTASGQNAWGDLVAMRDAAVVAAGPRGLGCTVTSAVEDPTDPLIYRTIDGTFTVPNFLETPSGGPTRIARDAAGHPVQRGTADASFIAIVPRSAVAHAVTGGRPAPVWTYGHGLKSGRDEVTRDFAHATAADAAAIAVATDFTGLTNADLGDVVYAFEDLNTFPTILDKLRQSVVNTVLLARTIVGACAALPAFSAQGALLTDPRDLGYFGNSLGGTMGSTVAALSPDVDRYALGVGGIDFSVMMPRAYGWGQIEYFFKLGYPARIDRDLLIVMSQQEWDLAESSAFAPHVLANPLPGSRAAHVLFQVGLYDTSTTNVASEMAGRTLGLPELTPTSHAVWGLVPASAPLDSAYVEYDLGLPPLPPGTQAPTTDDGVHEGVRRDPRAQAQIVSFLHTEGQVVDTCGGACAP